MEFCKDVVSQHHSKSTGPPPSAKCWAKAECLCDASRLLLVCVGQLFDAVLVPVTQQAEELAGVVTAVTSMIPLNAT